MSSRATNQFLLWTSLFAVLSGVGAMLAGFIVRSVVLDRSPLFPHAMNVLSAHGFQAFDYNDTLPAGIDIPFPALVLATFAALLGGGLLVVEVWESEAARDQWAQKVDKAIQELGGPNRPQPRKCEVHNVLTAETMSRLMARSRSTPRTTSGEKKAAHKTTRLAYNRVGQLGKSSKPKK